MPRLVSCDVLSTSTTWITGFLRCTEATSYTAFALCSLFGYFSFYAEVGLMRCIGHLHNVDHTLHAVIESAPYTVPGFLFWFGYVTFYSEIGLMRCIPHLNNVNHTLHAFCGGCPLYRVLFVVIVRLCDLLFRCWSGALYRTLEHRRY
jgi:hypothetical protein